MVESRFEALRTATTPLVGRDEEIELLMRRWEQAKSGDGCVVLISGEPGIGKSRIAETIVERLGGEPHTRLRYFCSPHHQDSALYPSIAQLERAAGFRREDTAEQRLAKLEAVLAQGTNDLSEAVPLLADLLSIPTGDRYPPLNLTPQKRKEKTLRAQLAQLEGLAARQPVLMVWEDVHWSDPTTRESLDLFIDRVPTLRVLVILTFRPEFTPPWIGRPHVTMLTLNRLPPRQRAEMIVHVTGGKALPKEIADQIVDRTDGVPLFIEELTKIGCREWPGRRKRMAITRRRARWRRWRSRHRSRPRCSPGSIGWRRPRGRADRSGARALVLARADQRRGAGCRSMNSMTRWSSWCSAELIFRRGDAARRRVHLQARAGAGRRLQHVAAQPAAAVACPHCRDAREPVLRERGG